MPSSLVSVPAAARSAISAGSVLRTTSRARWNALARNPLSWARSRQCITRSRAASGVIPATVPARRIRPGTIGRTVRWRSDRAARGEPGLAVSPSSTSAGCTSRSTTRRRQEFVDALDEINALAESSPGFVWRLKDEATGLSSSYVARRRRPADHHQPVGLGDARAAPRLRLPHGAHAVPAPAPGVVPEGRAVPRVLVGAGRARADGRGGDGPARAARPRGSERRRVHAARPPPGARASGPASLPG